MTNLEDKYIINPERKKIKINTALACVAVLFLVMINTSAILLTTYSLIGSLFQQKPWHETAAYSTLACVLSFFSEKFYEEKLAKWLEGEK